MTVKIYTASTLRHAEMWRRLVRENLDICFTARWPFTEVFDGDAHDQAPNFWSHDLSDVAYADVVLTYAVEGDALRGALIETGYGLALGKHVIIVGDHPSYGTWRRHRPIIHATTIEDALAIARKLGGR